ncbi:MAG: hypothetical protein HQL17_05505 [Candidatus Omnitrophica bacterium]|nr:hypothetical protein [Candidatus Omnitrophota bacterium]
MTLKTIIVLFVVLLATAMIIISGKTTDKANTVSEVVATAGGYQIMADEFAEGFAVSAFAARADKLQARREYLETLINQKLILLDAQKNGLDKAPDFLKSVEKFWTQSLLTVALGKKTLELHKGMNVRDEDVRQIYENMVKEGVTSKPLHEVYSQIKWQAEKQVETQLLNNWILELRKGAAVSVDETALKALK